MNSGKNNSTGYLAFMTLGALGVVFGDIGTSPLYAMRECFTGAHGVPLEANNVLGVLSLIFWSLIITISIKYLAVVLKADNRGEGGVLALMALANRELNMEKDRKRRVLVLLGLFGAALLYGDGVITPAISVLSAIEGLKVGTNFFEPYIIPITVFILVLLFLVQSSGTNRIGVVFGPIILIWFTCLGIMGIRSAVQTPQVFKALSPTYAIEFFAHSGSKGFAVLGAVFLVVTGGEAMYADMGHFGRRPIRIGWFTVALPALLFNYLGQGALLLRDPLAIRNPFFLLAPSWAIYPLVALAAMATVIASQAVISGSFSLTRQAVQLGYLPRLVIRHTSSDEIGQIYVPRVNWMLLLATVWLVLEFKTSSKLAAAYGIAVSTTMLITTLLMWVVCREIWKWTLPRTIGIIFLFIIIDLAFFGANITKFREGGWFPICLGAFIFTLMTTWRKGRQILMRRLQARAIKLEKFINQISQNPPHRISGTAVFMSGTLDGTPPALVHNVKHNRVIHENVVIMMVKTDDVPHVSVENRLTMEKVRDGFFRVVVHYGFKDSPNIPGALQIARGQGLEINNSSEVTYFLGRETLLATKNPGMAIWREELFAIMSSNAQRATAFFQIPPDQVVEIGLQVEL